ncbi:MAG: HAMP domain-containing sensor histidine kinase, partial [Patescibacteria group bacterium]
TIVEDFGKGIAEKDISNIFEPFYRGDQSRTDSEHEGYGLGLAISKEIVERHKGKITVESVLGSGSKFIVRLPISSQ